MFGNSTFSIGLRRRGRVGAEFGSERPTLPLAGSQLKARPASGHAWSVGTQVAADGESRKFPFHTAMISSTCSLGWNRVELPTLIPARCATYGYHNGYVNLLEARVRSTR
eukprot:6461141-Prymnesium_polylepis.1